MSICIGVDAGGTKTAVLIADGERIIARATGPAGAVRPGRALQAASRITVAIRRALTDARLLHGDVLVVGAAGVGRDPERTELRESLRAERLAERVIVTGDLDIALEAAFGTEPGIVLVSGTGSVAVGRAPDGALHRRGGYGWQMGDEGSGYAIGRAALGARRCWPRDRPGTVAPIPRSSPSCCSPRDRPATSMSWSAGAPPPSRVKSRR
jgi:glucosamine kinase